MQRIGELFRFLYFYLVILLLEPGIVFLPKWINAPRRTYSGYRLLIISFCATIEATPTTIAATAAFLI